MVHETYSTSILVKTSLMSWSWGEVLPKIMSVLEGLSQTLVSRYLKYWIRCWGMAKTSSSSPTEARSHQWENFSNGSSCKGTNFQPKNWWISFFGAIRNLPQHQEICPNILLWTILGAEHRPIESFWWHRALSAFSHVLILKYSHYSCISLKFFKFWMLLFLKNNL